MKNALLATLLFVGTVGLTACGTLTGIPSHGGGKRFAVEQELVAASARAAAKEMDLSALQGRKVALYISTMGDQGSGNISGGRYSIDALIRGEYLNTSKNITDYSYPRYITTANTNAGSLSSVTSSQSILNAPSQAINHSKGDTGKATVGLSAQGMGNYQNETLVSNPRDVSYLQNLIQSLFFLRGIEIVSPDYADVDMFIAVDVFGTIRSRTELHLHNKETLQALTKLEYFAVDRNTRQLLIKPTTSSFESQYQEKYALWMGPYQKQKTLQKSDGLLVDFSDITPYQKDNSPNKPTFQNQLNDDKNPEGIRTSEIIKKRQQGVQ